MIPRAEVVGMKRWYWAAALLFLSAELASADYVIIVANLGTTNNDSTNELRTQGAGMAGGQPGMGMFGNRGGPSAGMTGMPPGMANRGGMPGGMGGSMPPGGMMGMRGSMPPGGMGGSMPPGGMMGMRGGSMMGMRGGMMGMGGSMPPGGMMRGGMGMMGMMGMMMGGAPDVDDIPYFVVAVVEVEPTGGANVDLVKKLEPKTPGQIGMAKVKHNLVKNGTCTLLAKTETLEVFLIKKDNDHKSLPTVHRRFEEKFASYTKEKPSAELLLELAEWTLEHGLVDKFPLVMAKLIEADKDHPAAVAYQKVKAELDKPLARDEEASNWRNKLLSGYKVTEDDTHHYAIVHDSATSGLIEVQSHLELLENSFRGFYYWFALKGIALPVPKQRLVAVVTSREKDFKHFQKILTSSPVVVDGFFARRENLAVMASKRQDDTYEQLEKYWKNFEDKGYRKTDILSGRTNVGYPSGAHTTQPVTVHEARMVALMLKALEREAELATVSHEASRQLVFSTGLLPRNVAAPEWLMFGLGSFFETPLQSPWAGIAAPSSYYLPRWHELKAKGFEKKPEDTLTKVVTDAYFRSLPAQVEKDSPAHMAYENAVRKARTAAWSLTYFLAKQKLDGLQQYFKELGKMPRDIELDDEVLLGCFARAFGAVDSHNKVDKAQLAKLAKEWFSYMDNVKFESESTMKTIREIFRKKLQESQNQNNIAGQGQIDPNTGQPLQGGLPGMLMPGGGRGGPGNGTPPPGGIQPPGGRGGRPGGGGNNPP
jgi:hypothetical protein